ncbi:MAG: HDIG domain-containing protein [Calditrichaeota bacterium]|nr:HDIG domain-containing protein [Calditrichota bacterium]
MPTISKIFPQILHIQSQDLKDKVMNCWEQAVLRGDWIIEDLERMPFSLLTTGHDITLAEHTRNVTDCSLALGEILARAYKHLFKIDFDILTAGVLLHDVGKCLEYCRRPDGGYVVSADGKIRRHPISGCALAAEMGLPESVQHIIAAHSKEGDGGYRSPEAWIVHFADFANFEPLRSR